MRYHGNVIRPPSEAESLILQVTYGCSHGSCDFCGTYSDKPFAVRPAMEVARDVRELANVEKQVVRRVFLADGDAVALSTRRLLEILALLHEELPALERVSSYANATNLLRKTPVELRNLREAGLALVYLGLESGDDETLVAINKGVTVAEQIEGCRMASEAGIALSVTAILGLAGVERSFAHASATGRALSEIDPEYIGILTLMLMSGTPLAQRVAAQHLRLPDSLGMLSELRVMIEHTEVTNCVFRSNHASNYLTVGGHLPGDKVHMLAAIDRVLAAQDASALRPESWRLL